jgi:hypothetical protein
MKKQILIAGLSLALLPALAAAADFSGTYVRDAKASDPNGFPVYWMPRNPPAAGGGFGGPTEIVLKQSPTSLQITDPARRLRNLALDGKPHVETAETDVVKQTVTASQQGDAIVVATVLPYAGMPGGVVTNVKDTWSLSADGKVLTVTTVRTTPAAVQTSKQVYNKR